MTTPSLPSILEALLFVSGDPLSIKTLSASTGCSVSQIKKALDELETQLEHHGITILIKDEEVLLVTRPEVSMSVEHLVKEEFLGNLSKAALETLTIITYCHPLSRQEIDYVRGVNSTFTLRNLMMRGLVERVSPEGSRSYMYRPTLEFMKHLGIHSLSELPEYEAFRKEVERGRKEFSEVREEGTL